MRATDVTPLNERKSDILLEVLHTNLLSLPPRAERPLGLDTDKWCEFHRGYGHGTEDCRNLMWHIERLIQDGHLSWYVKQSTSVKEKGRSRSPRRQVDRPPPASSSHVLLAKGDLNTIAGGFARGGPTCSAPKRYTRSVMTVDFGQSFFPPHSPLMITEEDAKGIFPHEDDPMVISIVAAEYRIKLMLIDQGSSTDILY